MAEQPRILVLGGTGDGRRLADALVADGRYDVVSSLAGRTSGPFLPHGRVRVGGFGGVEGLARFIATERIALVADATHPFAAEISRSAVAASAHCAVAYVRIECPPWRPGPGDRWIDVPDLAAAARALPAGARVLLASGRQELAPFAARPDCTFLARVIEAPELGSGGRLPPHVTLAFRRPPYIFADELALIDAHAITHLVSKNAGGEATAAKLAAARARAVVVVMVARPTGAVPADATSVAGALALIARHLD